MSEKTGTNPNATSTWGSLFSAIEDAHRLLNECRRDSYAQHLPDGIVMSDAIASTTIYRLGQISLNELCEGMRISQPHGSQLLAQIVRKRLATKKRSLIDHRQFRIDLTSEGLSLVKTVARAEKQAERYFAERYGAPLGEALEAGAAFACANRRVKKVAP